MTGRSAASGSVHSKNKYEAVCVAFRGRVGWMINFINCVLRSAASAGAIARLTFLTVVKLVKLAGFVLALAEHQVVSDVPVGLVGRLPLQDDLGGRVG